MSLVGVLEGVAIVIMASGMAGLCYQELERWLWLRRYEKEQAGKPIEVITGQSTRKFREEFLPMFFPPNKGGK